MSIELALCLVAVASFALFSVVVGYLRGAVTANDERARAQILSLREDVVGSVLLGTKRFTIVYEVHPEGQPPFRVRGTETMDFVQQRANPLGVDGWVHVRFNKGRTAIALDRVPSESASDMVAREAREAREKEERLLREPPS
jgi:hypothetical protein